MFPCCVSIPKSPGAGSFKDDDEQIIKGLTSQIESMIVEDWRDYYINYAFLKRILARQDRKKYGEEKKRSFQLITRSISSQPSYGTLDNIQEFDLEQKKQRSHGSFIDSSSRDTPSPRRPARDEVSPRPRRRAFHTYGPRSFIRFMENQNPFDNSGQLFDLSTYTTDSSITPSTTDDDKQQEQTHQHMPRHTLAVEDATSSHSSHDKSSSDSRRNLRQRSNHTFPSRTQSSSSITSSPFGVSTDVKLWMSTKSKRLLRRKMRRRLVLEKSQNSKSKLQSWTSSRQFVRITQDMSDPSDWRARFWVTLFKNLEKSETFQADQEVILQDEVKELKVRLKRAKNKKMDTKHALTLLNLQSACILAYRSSIMLRNFAVLNFAAVKKLAIRYCNLLEEDALIRSYITREILDRTYFATSKAPETLSEEIVSTYAMAFEDGSRDRAVAVLQTKMTDIRIDHWDSFRLGVKSCLVVVLVSMLVWKIMFSKRRDEYWSSLVTTPAYETYRGLGFLLLIPFLWGLNIHFWQKKRINYVYIFEFNPRKRLTDVQMIEVALNNMLIYSANLFLYLTQEEFTLTEWVHPVAFPTVLLLYFLSHILTGWAFPSLSSRWNNYSVLVQSLGHVLISPFGRCRFLDSIVADVLTSTVKIWIDVWHVVRWYSIELVIFLANFKHSRRFAPQDMVSLEETEELSTEQNSAAESALLFWKWVSSDSVMIPLLSALPLWIRFQQCINRYFFTHKRFPYLVNALKYALAHTIVIAGTFHPTFSKNAVASEWPLARIVWLLSTISSTIYTFVWDITMDWGLMDANFGYLREKRLFPYKHFYYWAIVSNLVLRFSWTLTLTPFAIFNQPNLYQYVIVPLVVFFELFRRFQWTILRVEYEHIKHSTVGFQTTPVFFDNEREKREREKYFGDEPSLYWQSFSMVVALIIVAILVALM